MLRGRGGTTGDAASSIGNLSIPAPTQTPITGAGSGTTTYTDAGAYGTSCAGKYERDESERVTEGWWGPTALVSAAIMHRQRPEVRSSCDCRPRMLQQAESTAKSIT
eukprot:347016-Chlamydomonas_euryale.AAC.12